MPRRLSTEATSADNTGSNIVPFPTPQRVKNPAAVALGKLGGSKGGTIRAQSLSTERKIAIARQGGLARQAMARLKKQGEVGASRLGGISEEHDG